MWFLIAPERLPPDVATELSEGEAAPVLSVLSVWEIAIKAALGKLPERLDACEVRELLILAGWRELPFTGDHAVATQALPMVHSDPFDRGLIAQARSEGTILLTADKRLKDYGAAVRLVKPRKRFGRTL